MISWRRVSGSLRGCRASVSNVRCLECCGWPDTCTHFAIQGERVLRSWAQQVDSFRGKFYAYPHGILCPPPSSPAQNKEQLHIHIMFPSVITQLIHTVNCVFSQSVDLIAGDTAQKQSWAGPTHLLTSTSLPPPPEPLEYPSSSPWSPKRALAASFVGFTGS